MGERIRARRLLRGWSVRYAASRARVSHATWSRIERGRQAADNRFVLAELAAALECAPADLVGTVVPAADRAAVAAHSAVRAIRQALINADLSEKSEKRPEQPGEQREIELLDGLRQACDYAGATRRIPALLHGLHAQATTKPTPEVLTGLCHVTFIASSVLRNLGHPAESWLAAERCRETANAAGDPVLRAYAGYARATAATACGSWERGLALADRAAAALRPYAHRGGGRELIGSLHLVGAAASRALRRTGDSLARAAEAEKLARRTGETTTLGMYFGPTNVAIWRIGIEADGGDPQRAAELARATQPAAIPASFRQVFYYADTARALAGLRDRGREAVRFLLTAERLAPQHVHTSTVVRETARSLLERSRTSELRGLCERLQVGA